MSPSVNLPVTLTANTPENVNDLNANLNALTGALNGGLDETNVPNLAAAFTTYRTVLWGSGTATSGAVTVGGNYGLYPTAGSATTVWTAGLAAYTFYLDPADWAANARTTRLRLRAQCVVNATAPGATVTPGLYPVTSFGGAAGTTPTIVTIGAVVAGSTVAITTPAASSNTVSTSTDFNAPAAGAYVFMFAASGAFAANSQAALMLQLQMRQV